MCDTGLKQLARSCWPKEQHASQGAAEAHLRALIKLGKERDAEQLRAYKCHHCGKHHVGHLGGV